MAELGKIIKVIEKQSSINEILLVIDATTGQNGINQAKSFIESVGVTGLILTKLDGGAKGGIGIAIEKEFDLPVKFAGWGEQVTDLAAFDPDQYLESLFE
jgi:fused signal recognition particle receptor